MNNVDIEGVTIEDFLDLMEGKVVVNIQCNLGTPILHLQPKFGITESHLDAKVAWKDPNSAKRVVNLDYFFE